MATICIKYCDIPSYLHAGDFYRNLDSDDPEGIIEIPADCFHPDGKIAVNLEEFRQLLRVMDFWILDDILVGVLRFCEDHEVKVWYRGFIGLPDAGAFKVLQVAFPSTDFNNNTFTATAIPAFQGNLLWLQYLHEEGFAWDANTCARASENGHLDCLQYAHENDCSWDVNVYSEAAKKGHLSCVEYAFQQGLEWHTDVCWKAAWNGHLNCLRFAHENGCPWDNRTTIAAAQEGHVDCLLYALEHGCPVDNNASNLACAKGHLECLKLLHLHGASWNAYTASQATMSPSVNCLQYLRENGCPWDEDTSRAAAEHGRIQPLRYALEQGCPYHGYIVQIGVKSGDLECLQYAIEDQSLFMDESVFLVALLRGDLTCLQYIVDQGCPYLDARFPGDTDGEWERYDRSFGKGYPGFISCLKYAVERGWKLDKNLIQYIWSRDELCSHELAKYINATM